MIPASKYFSTNEMSAVELTEEEKKMAENIKVVPKLFLWFERRNTKRAKII